ncbi:E3 SUMO-protein ligase NSE2-like [Aricia agestis]|uniref:E3 SUMO-protein ligase NSE2-like n=1 Tax=Aricia agestis TaxID=91739 RepID=UPI001C2078D5|nr:E3 SUMO-protein ligase NSE2-like [Aricia agestis]
MSDLDLATLRKQCITSLYLCTDNVSKYLEAEKETEFNKLKGYVEEYCLLEAQQDVAFQALEKAKNETDASNVESLDARFSEHLSGMASRRLNVRNHPYMLELDKRIKKGLQNARPNLDESDLAITESQERYVDPITKKPIEDPVRNSLCGHIYERQTIMELINKKNRVRCPVAGCGHREPLQPHHLLCDEELRFRVALTLHSTAVAERSTMDLDNTA